MATDDQRVRAAIQEREQALLAEKKQLDARDASMSSARGITFLVAAGLGLYGLFQPAAPVWIGAGAAFAVFLVFVVRHALVAARQFDNEKRIDLARRALLRIDGKFRASDDEAHRRGQQFATPGHANAADLDLFGKGSLFEQLDVAQTPAGEARLAAWLLAPASSTTVAERQAAVRELAGQNRFREELALAGTTAASSSSIQDHRALVEWARTNDPPVPALPLLALLAAQLGLGVAAAIGPAYLLKVWGVAVGAQIAAMIALRGRLEAVLGPIAHRQSPLGRYPEMMRVCEEQTFEDALLSRHRATLRDRGGGSTAMAKLDGLVGFAAVRHNALIHVLADVFLMWDAWAAWRLDNWRRELGDRVETWIAALADIEALACLATFAAEHPSFAWPSVTAAAEPYFRAKNLGHPLIASGRVGNDVALGHPDALALMITGSNMSGKSTMLRSMGIAAVLAQAGAPVCADELTMSELVVWTSMRVDDSLEEGASRFFAEVRRLKAVSDAVRSAASAAPAGEPRAADRTRIMFLLDEVLHGTNSRERIIGAKAVVADLVGRGAIGAVSSHDLGLVDLERETDGKVLNVHFEDQVEDGEIGPGVRALSEESGPAMHFDYRMKRGPVATSNALRLMRQVGIDVVPLQ
jgi:hypothetical protein